MATNLSLLKFVNYLVIAFFFVPYFGLIPVAYGVMLLMIVFRIGNHIKGSYYDFFFLIPLFLLSAFKFNQVGFLVADALFRYYLGIVIVYWFFKIYNVRIDVQRLLLFFCIAVLLEAVIINIFFDPFRYLPNYPASVFENNIASHYTKFMGFYQRPYSIGMNASASSSVLCGLLMCRWEMIKAKKIIEDKRLEFIGGATVFLFASGVGIGLYFFYLLHRFGLITLKRFIILILICYLLIVNYDAIFGFFSSDSIFQKVSSAYINFLLDYKIEQIDDVVKILESGKSSVLIGQAFENKSEIILQSDFAWNDFFQCLGIFGIILFFLFLLNKINKHTLFPILLFVIGALHYGGVFTLAGQIVLSIALIELTRKADKETHITSGIVPLKN